MCLIGKYAVLYTIGGLPPNPEGSTAPYTAPTIRLPDGTFIMDSKNIAEMLQNL